MPHDDAATTPAAQCTPWCLDGPERHARGPLNDPECISVPVLVPVGPEDELGVFAAGMVGEEPHVGFTLNGEGDDFRMSLSDARAMHAALGGLLERIDPAGG